MKNTLLIIILFVSLNIFANEDEDENEYKGMYICYNSSLIEAEAHYDRVQWPDSQLTNVCSLSFGIYSINPAHFYYTRKWKDPSYCREFMRDWNELRKKNKKICIAGDLHSPSKVKHEGVEVFEQSAPWEIIRSGKWCRSYFVRDNCD